MQIVIDINEKDYDNIMFDVETSPRLLNRYEWLIAHGRPFPIVQADMLAKIRAEIEQFAEDPNFGDLSIGASCGAMKAIEIIDKYKAESEEENG